MTTYCPCGSVQACQPLEKVTIRLKKADEQPGRSVFVPNPDAMDDVGRILALNLNQGDVVAVSGSLGAGKSHLCRAIVRTLLQDDDAQVPSPSYTLVNVYDLENTQIWHVDLYRVSDPEEFNELGLDDQSDAILLVEWPERWESLPERHAEIRIGSGQYDGRTVDLTVHGTSWDQLVEAWKTLQ